MIVKKRNSIGGKLVVGFSLTLLILIAVLTSVICVRLKKESLSDFSTEWQSTLSHVGNTISIFFDSTLNSLSMICEEESVRAADNSLHSYTNETGKIKVADTIKSPKEQEIVTFFKNVDKAFPAYVEVYFGSKWGGYATSFDGDMTGGYDPRKRTWYEQAIQANGKPIITDAYLSTVGDVVVGLSKSVYDNNNVLIGNAGIEITLKTITQIIGESKVGNTGFIMAIQEDGTIIADPRHTEYVSKTLDETKVDSLKKLSSVTSGTVALEMDEKEWFAQVYSMQNPKWKLVAFMEESEVLKDYSYVATTMIMLGIILLILFAVGTALFALRLLRPTSSIVEEIEKISKGDFTSNLKINTKDEFSVIADSFNVAVENIRTAMGSVHNSTEQVLSAGDSLVSNMTETVSSVQQIHSHLAEVKKQTETQAASVTDTTSTIKDVINSIGSLNANIEKQSVKLAESSASVQKMLESMEAISTTLKENENLINILFKKTSSGKEKVLEAGNVTKKIEEESENLLEASTVIQNVAKNTNLLAMNAAIEAAHVGENGKGFAVVADEIRKLAQDSDEQGKRIAEVIQESLDIIRSLTIAKKEEEEVFNEIYNMAETVFQKQKMIIDTLNELSSGNREVLIGIDELSNVTNEVKRGSKEMLQGSETVSNEMTRLNNLTIEINSRVAEVSNSAVQINDAIQEVGTMSQLCTESMTELSSKINKFKVS